MNKKKLIALAGFGVWAGRKVYKQQRKKKEQESVYRAEVRVPTKTALKERATEKKSEVLGKLEGQYAGKLRRQL